MGLTDVSELAAAAAAAHQFWAEELGDRIIGIGPCSVVGESIHMHRQESGIL
jgi:hypothetical protein